MVIVLAVLLILGSLVAVLSPLWVPASGRRAPAEAALSGADSAWLRELLDRRDAAYAALRDLELDQAVGNLSFTDYADLRQHHRRRAAVILKTIVERTGEIDADIERRVATLAAGHGAMDPAKSNGPGGRRSAAPGRVSRPNGAAGAAAQRRRRSLGWASAAVITAFWMVAAAVLYQRDAATSTGQTPVGMLPIQRVSAVVYAHRDPLMLFAAGPSGVFASVTGATWTPRALPGSTRQRAVRAFAASAAAPDTIILAGIRTLLRSSDGGATWHVVRPYPLSADVSGLAADPLRPGVVYALLSDGGLARSLDDGNQWRVIAPGALRDGTALAVAAAPAGMPTLFVATSERGVLRSADGGHTWQPGSGQVNGALASRQVTGLALDATTNTLYAAIPEGLYRSQDAGSSWLRLPFQPTPLLVAANPSDGRTIVVVTASGAVYHSADRGLSWRGAP